MAELPLYVPGFQERLVILCAVLLRVLVGLSSYSGMNDPPKYGDYEAQRHWMELTINLPPKQWYTESSVNSASYWPLDYPPLSGYQSWVHGQLLKQYEPAAVTLGPKSYGYETPTSKRLMRATVLLSDLLIFFPMALAACRALYGPRPSTRRAFALAATLLNPALIIIDHGHFQFNCISLGLAVGGAAAIATGRHLLGSFLFCGSLNHKQMALYYAPAFFAHLLGKCLTRRGFFNKIWGVIRLGVVVIASFALMWLPWLTSEASVREVVNRIFPLKRGLFEDYVANWWCVSSAVIKWKQIVPADRLVFLSACATLALAVPCMLQQLWRPSSRGLVMAMANSGAAFFMLAYQVHEKSVLLPLAPVMLLAGDQPTVAAWMPLIAMVSMYPLLIRDGLTLPYVALCLIWGALMLFWAPHVIKNLWSRDELDAYPVTPQANDAHHETKAALKNRGIGFRGFMVWVLGSGFVVAALALHVAKVVVPPPPNLPWLYDRAFVTLGFAGLVLVMLHLQIAQWRLPPQVTFKWDEQDQTKRKKRL